MTGEKTPCRERKLVELGTEVLFTRYTEFLIVLKNSKCKTSVIKSLKIAYVSGFTKKGKKI